LAVIASTGIFVHDQPFDAHCCHMGAAINHPMPDRVKPFAIFDIWALWRSALSQVKPVCCCCTAVPYGSWKLLLLRCGP